MQISRVHGTPERFQTGHVLKGKRFYGEKIAHPGTLDGSRYHNLRLVVDNSSDKSVKVFLDGVKMGAFQEHFAPRLKGGVFTIHSFENIGLFKNFAIEGCKNFNEIGQCTDSKLPQIAQVNLRTVSIAVRKSKNFYFAQLSNIIPNDFLHASECVDESLGILTTKYDMESNGWKLINITNPFMQYYHSSCETSPSTWYGFCGGHCIGTVQAIFQKSGTAQLGFGNCNSVGSVDVFLNGSSIARAIRSNKNATITFQFKRGDVVEISESPVAIIKLSFFNIKCKGKSKNYKVTIQHSILLIFTKLKTVIYFIHYYSLQINR